MALDISVVICTFNRADYLTTALEALSQQTAPRESYEVIVVDNGSADRTREVVESFMPGVRYIVEPKAGLSNARNTGAEAAEGRYVAYTDDDCKVPPQWLSVAKGLIDDPGPLTFGGPILPYYTVPRPRWFKDQYETIVCRTTPGPLEGEAFLTGCNMFIRRDLISQYGWFSPHLGMIGNQLWYGEETDLLLRIQNDHPDVQYYDPDLWLQHAVRPAKLRLGWRIRSLFSRGRGQSLWLDARTNAELGRQCCRAIPRTIYRFLFGTIVRDRKRYPYIQNYLFERAADDFFTLGAGFERLVHCLGRRRSKQ